MLCAWLARLETERRQLEEERYARFAATLQAVNGHLSRIFCRLSGLQGDAYCSHPDSCALLAAQGVAFHVRRGSLRVSSLYRGYGGPGKPGTVEAPPYVDVTGPHGLHRVCELMPMKMLLPVLAHRPDNRCWRAFGALSGGQQALASLALTFALQVSSLRRPSAGRDGPPKP